MYFWVDFSVNMHINALEMHIYEHKKQPAAEAKIPIAIIGARGYSGLELVRILLKHPGVKIEACVATDSDFCLSHWLPEQTAETIPVTSIHHLEQVLNKVHTVFLATPAEASIELAPRILKSGVSVIDLSGAFRLEAENAQQYYGIRGDALSILPHAEYGLIPWIGPAKNRENQPSLIANPGCYATSILMAILPLLKENIINTASLVIDSKSGTTGAGRKATENLLFSEVDGECIPYRIGTHQHFPEIVQYASHFASIDIDPLFSTHLLGARRGIISGIYARTLNNMSIHRIETAYSAFYSNYPLVRWGRINPNQPRALSLKRVVGSARTEIQFELKGNQLYIFSLIDNLIKGAAGQAIENFNRIYDFPITTSLLELEGVL